MGIEIARGQRVAIVDGNVGIHWCGCVRSHSPYKPLCNGSHRKASCHADGA